MEITNKDWECVIEKDILIEVQKKLNQWRHEYDLRIVDTHIVPNTEHSWKEQIVVVLWRKRK
jgi:hypothetical protein